MGYHHHTHIRTGYHGGGGVYRVGGGYSTPAGGCVKVVVAVVVFLLIGGFIAGIVVAFALPSTIPRPCPTNTGLVQCPTCTSHIPVINCASSGGGGNTTTSITCSQNGTHEVCWEHLLWSDLTVEQKKLWETLGQSQSAWDGAIEPYYDCWDDMTFAELDAAEKLGYEAFTWDFGSSCAAYYSYFYNYFYSSYYYSYYYYFSYYFYSGWYYYYW